ncbi:type IIL restriction-modification enzyme MmeI, partial [Polaromonas sp.]|nr:class I SAM-dependent DNA methyltransferase [Polaromonas sp.]
DLNAPHGRLLTVMGERPGEHGEVNVLLSERQGQIHADLSVGANVASAGPLRANENLSNRGVQLFGAGFIVTPEEAALLLPLPLGEGRGEGQPPQHIIRDYRNGRDLTDAPRGVKVIDAFGLTSEQLRGQFPAVYQWLLERVKPERDQNNRAGRRDNWWLFGETNPKLRKQLAGLARYIATVETAKHRTFQFVDASILPDNMLVAVASSDAFHLGVLSSSSHVVWSLATGGRLGVGNDPRYNKSRCFETFPFPDDDTGLTPALRQHIAALAEQIDAHRKRQQAAHPGLSLTGMYNVLEALREGRELTAKEKAIHTQGLVSVLKDLHDELDAAVLQAYGLEPGLSNDALLTQLVALNARRAAEEKTGRIRWLRPEFQNPAPRQTLPNQELSAPTRQGLQAEMVLENEAKPAAGKTPGQATQPWPASLPAQVRALAEVLAGHPGALTVAEIEARFKGRGPWKKSLPRILETLEALGRARRDGESWRE